jgi:hypothetical protein
MASLAASAVPPRRPLWKLLGLEMADRKLEGSLCRMVSRGKIKIKSWENRIKRRPESVIENQGKSVID